MDEQHILITGITGFIGSHLVQYLKGFYPQCKITGIGRQPTAAAKNYNYYSIDLLDKAAVTGLIDRIRPDYIFHLAGLVFSYDWDELYRQNITSTINLLEAIRKIQLRSRVVISGSSAEYGIVPIENLPVTEDYSSVPSSPYGMIKLWQTLLAKYYSTASVPVIIGRIFNVIGYGASAQLATGDFFSQLVNIKQRSNTTSISVGNIEIKRDFLDIDDVCSALIKLAVLGQQGTVYNICSGSSTVLRDVFNSAISLAGVKAEIFVGTNKSQNLYVENIYGCNIKIKTDTNWEPTVDLESSIKKALCIRDDY